MPGGTMDADFLSQLDILCRVGVVGDVSDGQLLQRLTSSKDGCAEAPFTLLVERHGPMVLRICQQILGNPHDAEDAFQVTFLILARKAKSVRKADSVAGWLHGVARRVAVRAKTDAARRKVYELRVGLMNAGDTERMEDPFESWLELHEEISRLPWRYREPIVLCYLEGLTTEAAASRVGCPKGTILSRLSRGRERLRGRLIRRGVTLTTDVIASGTTSKARQPALSAPLVKTAVHAALGFAARRANEATVASTPVTALATGVLSAMVFSRLKAVIAVILCSGLALGAMQAFAYQRNGSLGQEESKAEKRSEPEGIPTPAEKRSPRSDRALAEAQLKIARQALVNFESLQHRGDVSYTDPRFLLWERRQVEALRESGAGKEELVKALEWYFSQVKRQELTASVALAKGEMKAEEARLFILDAKYRAVEAEIWLNQVKAQ